MASRSLGGSGSAQGLGRCRWRLAAVGVLLPAALVLASCSGSSSSDQDADQELAAVSDVAGSSSTSVVFTVHRPGPGETKIILIPASTTEGQASFVAPPSGLSQQLTVKEGELEQVKFSAQELAFQTPASGSGAGSTITYEAFISAPAGTGTVDVDLQQTGGGSVTASVAGMQAQTLQNQQPLQLQPQP